MSFAFPVTQSAVDAVVYRLSLSDPDGFNGVFNGLAVNYGVAADMAIVWTGETSPNFVIGNIDPDEWIDAAAVSFPFMTVFGVSSRNRNLVKFHQFAGPVIIGVNVFLSWENSRAIRTFQELASCVEETMYTVFNRARMSNPGDQEWDFPSENVDVVYNGDLEMAASRVQRGGESWKQLLAFKASFQVDAKGEV